MQGIKLVYGDDFYCFFHFLVILSNIPGKIRKQKFENGCEEYRYLGGLFWIISCLPIVSTSLLYRIYIINK